MTFFFFLKIQDLAQCLIQVHCTCRRMVWVNRRLTHIRWDYGFESNFWGVFFAAERTKNLCGCFSPPWKRSLNSGYVFHVGLDHCQKGSPASWVRDRGRRFGAGAAVLAGIPCVLAAAHCSINAYLMRHSRSPTKDITHTTTHITSHQYICALNSSK